uniref:Uncharacterized protein n=1 Tax=Rhizophora mucronata TaxID=61149 RepID=A0A2P2LD27_RHIMU
MALPMSLSMPHSKIFLLCLSCFCHKSSMEFDDQFYITQILVHFILIRIFTNILASLIFTFELSLDLCDLHLLGHLYISKVISQVDGLVTGTLSTI